MSRARRPVEPILHLLIEGRVQKQIASDLGLTRQCINNHLLRFVKESGAKTLLQAVVKFARKP